MYTINIYLRLALIAVCIIGGVLLAIFQGFWYAFPFLLIGIFLVVGYILLGTVQSSALLVQKMDFQGALKRLELTFKPNWLYKPNRAYFYMVKGTIAMQFKNYPEAENFLMKSKEIGMPGDNEKAMVYLQLANLASVKNNWTAAKAYIKETKDLKVTEAQIKEQIQEFSKALKQGPARSIQHRNRGMIHQGGKRRRPKMR